MNLDVDGELVPGLQVDCPAAKLIQRMTVNSSRADVVPLPTLEVTVRPASGAMVFALEMAWAMKACATLAASTRCWLSCEALSARTMP